MSETGVPVVDVGALVHPSSSSERRAAADAIGRACREVGFFYAVGHDIDAALQARLEARARQFFAWPDARKAAIAMQRGGRAWRGWFPVGAELTSGRPDHKEGLYLGAELDDAHPLVRAGTPLHGPNLFPDLPGFRDAVLAWIDAMTGLGHALMRGIALSLDLPEDWFAARYTADPLVLFRIFRYPPLDAAHASEWSVGEHTDYGVLTILLQDDAGGLQVRSRSSHSRSGEVRFPRSEPQASGEDQNWIEAPPVDGSFVCNIGDMLDRMTGGLYRSTPHRVRNAASRDRFSFPFFFDPSWSARVRPIPGCEAARDDAAERWDRASVHEWSGTYGDYLLAKVGRVFPELGRKVL